MEKTRVLIVEDEAIVAKDLETRLKNVGYAVSGVVLKGQDVMDALARTVPDLILMDIALKGEQDGIETAQWIRETYDIPIIYLTSHSDPTTLKRAKVTDPFGYLLKPFEEKELMAAIEMALYKFKMERELRERERWLSTVLTSIGDAVIVTDVQGTITFMNPVAQSLTGWTQEDALGQAATTVFRLFDKEPGTPLADYPVEQVLKEGHPHSTGNHDAILIARSGAHIPITSRIAPIRDDLGKITGTVLTFHDITEQVQAEAERDEQQRMLRTLLDTLPDFILFKDRDFKYVVCNKTFADCYGLSETDIIGKTDFDILPRAEDAQWFHAEDVRVFESGQTVTDRHLTETPRGPIWAESVKTPLRNKQGEIVGIIVAARDITERMQVEAERDRQRQMLLALLNTTPDIVVFKNRDSVYQAWSETYHRLLAPELPKEGLLGQTDFDLYSQAEAERFRAEELHVIETGETIKAEHWLETREGRRCFEAVKMPLLDTAGKVIGVFTSERDITDRLQAESERDEQRRMLRAVLDTLPDFIIFKDNDSVFRVCNKAFCEFLGLSEEEIIGKTDFDVFPPDEAAQYRAEELHVMSTEQTEVNVHLLDGPGGIRLDEAIKTPLRNKNGEIIGVLTAGRDVTERKRHEDSLARRAREMTALYKTSLAINARQDVSALLENIVKRAAELVDANHGGLFLTNPAGKTLELAAGYNLAAGFADVKVPLGEGISGRVAVTGETMFLSDYSTWEHRSPAFAGTPFRRVLSVPLKADNRVIGVLDVGDTDKTVPFAEEEVRLVNLFADQAAIAVETARLHEEMQHELNERKRAEAELRQQRDFAEGIVETAQAIVLVLDTAGRIVRFNAFTEELTGYRLEEVQGQDWFTTFMSESNRHVFRDLFIQEVSGRSFSGYVGPIITRDGRERGIEWFNKALQGEDGQIIGILAIGHDMTDTLRTAELTRIQRDLGTTLSGVSQLDDVLRLSLQAALNICEMDCGGIYLVDDETGDLNLAYHEGSSVRFSQQVPGHAMTSQSPLFFEKRSTYQMQQVPANVSFFRDPEGLHSSAMIAVQDEGHIIAWLVIASKTREEIAESSKDSLEIVASQAGSAISRALAEDALRRERDFTAQTLDTTEALVLVTDIRGRILLFNRKCQEVSGYTEQEVLGRVLWEFLIPLDARERVRQALGNWPEQTPPTYYENPWLTKSGEVIPLAWRNAMLSPEAAGDTLIIASGLDISERIVHEREIERRNRDLTILYEALKAGSSHLVPRDVFGQVVHALATTGGYAIASAYLLEEGALRLCRSIGGEVDLTTIDPTAGILGRLLRTGEPQFVPDTRADAACGRLSSNSTSQICVPIKLDDQIAGVLNIESRDNDNALTQNDFQLMLALADQLRLVMHNASLYQHLVAERARVEHFNEQLLALQQISTATISHLDLDDLLNFVAHSATELLGGDRGSIFLFNSDGRLIVHGSCGPKPHAERGDSQSLGHSITSLVAQTGKPMIVGDALTDQRFRNTDTREEQFLSLISTPLSLGKHVIGALNVYSSECRYAFGEDHLRILSLLANQTAVAIESARLYTATADSELRYRSLFESTLEGIIVVDAETGLFLEANPAFQKMLGYSLEELRKRAIWELRDPDDQAAAKAAWLDVMGKGTGQGRVVPYRAKDGHFVEAEFIAQVIEWGGKRVEIATIQDVTEKLQLEEQLRQSQKMEAIGTLAGGVAHDFNNLLGSILGYASFVKESLAPDSQERADVEVIERSARRGADLTRQLLAFAQGSQHDIKPLNINAQVREVMQLLTHTIDKSIAINAVLDERIALVEGDEGQINQLLLNLCINACEAMPGGGYLTIRTQTLHLDAETARRELGQNSAGDYTLLTVSDTGHGMPPEIVERVFEPFFSTKKGRPGKKHSGLGLATVFGIVKAHDGIIRVESQIGEGTTFHVWFPANVNLRAEEENIAEPESPKGSETILVVDDEESLRDMLQRVLSNAGYEVQLVSSGTHAVDIVRRATDLFDLIILDIVMPGMNGLETFQKLKEINPAIRVLVASGYSDQGQAQDLLAAGAKDFIQKPFSFQEILSKVRTLLDKEKTQ